MKRYLFHIIAIFFVYVLAIVLGLLTQGCGTGLFEYHKDPNWRDCGCDPTQLPGTFGACGPNDTWVCPPNPDAGPDAIKGRYVWTAQD